METEINGAPTITRDVVVRNKAGLHLRPASRIVKALADMKCEVTLRRDNTVVTAKSIMSVTTLIAPKDAILTIEASGPEAEAAVKALVKLFYDKFGEE